MTAGILLWAIALTSGSAALPYANLHSTTERPFPIDRSQFGLCTPPTLERELGPHDQPALKMYLNEMARSGVLDRERPMQVGATIFKEKWPDENAKQPIAYAAMIKRPAGYDAQHGNWEYVYAELEGKRRMVRGRIASCIACHQGAAKRDYVFGRHLQAKLQSPESIAKPVSVNK